MNLPKDFFTSPRFIVIGGHKCGTSSLHHYLKQHPDIVMPKIKGEDLLNKVNLDIEAYEKSYELKTSEKIFGEVSSVYFQSEKACQTIKEYFPHSKLLMVLRNPVDRAFSDFNALSNRQQIKGKFKDIAYRPQPSNKIVKLGFYYNTVKLYIENFERDQFKSLIFDDFVKNKEKFYKEFFQFVEVDDSFLPDTSVIVRKGGQVKHKKLQNLLFSNPIIKNTASTMLKPFTNTSQRYNLRKKVDNMFIEKKTLSKEMRENLMKVYREDILKTQDLLDIDLSHWFNLA